ncbi:MAG: insulinase family protein [Proteobacteria bacterium]|nr:insulinase family protein [Pseudomonadota bacterium]
MSSISRRPRHGLLALCLSAALAAPAFAAAGADIAYTQFTLPNGLRVIVHEDHKAPIVAVNLWYHVGSKDELPGKTGFAHLYEHLMFQGSENHHGEFFDPFEKSGATNQNGTTNSDRTNFFENVPTTALDMALWMESDRMGHLLGGIDQAALDEQRGVVENEKRQGENQPYGMVDEVMSAAMYPVAHPYHHTTIGSKVDLDAASLTDVKAWFRNWYGPNNCVLVLAGDIDAATAKAKVMRYFGDIPASPTLPVQAAWPAPLDKPDRAVLQDRVAQPRIYRAWNVPAFGSVDSQRLQLLAQVFGGSQSSRLDTRLVHHDKLADHVSAAVNESELGSQFVVTADVKQGVDPAKVEAIIDEELQRLLRDGPSAAETARAQTVYEAAFIRGIERIGGFGGKADVLAECAVFTGDPGCFRKNQQELASATPAQVAAAGRQWLGKNDYVLVVQPLPPGQARPERGNDSTAALPFATSKRPAPTVDPKFTTTKSDVDRSKGVPMPTSFPALAFPALQHARLDNGLQVVLAERHEIPVVQMSMQFRGGFAADAGGKLGTSSFTMGMLTQGAGKYDALALGDAQEDAGARIGAGASLDTAAVGLNALKGKLDPSLALYADVILHPTFDAQEIERVRKTWLAGIAQEKTQPVSLALRVLPPLMYQAGHPYAIPFSGRGTEDSIRSLTRADLVAFDQKWLRPDNATLVVVGDTTLAELLPKLQKTFGAWQAPAAPLPSVQVGASKLPSQPRVFLIDQPGALQATLMVGQPTRSARGDDIWQFDLANDVIGGQFSARLNMNLREDKHWAYGAYSFAASALGPEPWLAYSPVQIDQTGPALAQMHQEIDAFVTGKKPATAAELAQAKANETRSLPGSFETGAAVLGQIAAIVNYGRGDDYPQRIPHLIDAVTLEQVGKAAAMIQPQALTWVVVGDLKKIEAPVRALNIGQVSIIDADGKPVAVTPAGK